MGGVPPYGYRVENRKLVVDDESTAHVCWIFARFLEIGSCTELAREVGARGIRTPRGNRIDKKYLYRMLSNRAYIGEAAHKGESYPGEHDAIIDRETWDKVHAILQESPRKRADTPALLKGLLFGPDGAAFSPTHTRKGGRLYRYYVSQTVLKHGAGSCPVGRVPAGDIEAAVIDQLRAVFRQPECHDAIADRGAHAVIPPRRNAKPWKTVTAGAAARNEALRAAKYLGRALWRGWSGYHRRSRVETKMHCLKLLGQRLMARDFDRQLAELQVRIAVLNGYTALGMPVTDAVA